MSVAANRYAKALMDVLYPKDAETGLNQLERLSALMATQPEAVQMLENPTIPAESRKALLGKIADAYEFTPPVRRFLDLLVDRNRVDILDEVTAAYRKFYDERAGIVRAHVTAARQLDAAEQQDLASRLESATGKKVRMDVTIDPALIGGVVAQVGSTIYDGSLRQQLQTFKSRLRAE